MPLQFQPPNVERKKSKGEAFAEPLIPAIQSLPLLYMQHQNQKKQLELQALEMELKKRQLQSQFGTGEAAPNLQNASPDMLQQGVPPAAPSGAGQEEQLFGDVGSMPTVKPETPQQEISRIGTDQYKVLHPNEPSYVIPNYDAGGNVSGFTPLPKGTKGFGGGKPQTPFSPMDKETAKLNAKLASEKPKAYGSLQNTLQQYDSAIKEAEAIRDDPSVGKATGLLSPLGSVPGTGPRRVAARLETLKAKTMLDVLGSLKELSKNGASGFGALSEKEGEAIRNSISTLDRKQSTEDFKAGLDRLIGELKDRKQNLSDTFNSTYGENLSPKINQTGRIRVKNKLTGQTGTISESNLDESKYERL